MCHDPQQPLPCCRIGAQPKERRGSLVDKKGRHLTCLLIISHNSLYFLSILLSTFQLDSELDSELDF